jgi:hypothetical protein
MYRSRLRSGLNKSLSFLDLLLSTDVDPFQTSSGIYTHAQWRLSGGQVQTRPAHAPTDCWGSFAGRTQTALGLGPALTDRQLCARDSVNLALHPCQKASDLLPYSRPPDFCRHPPTLLAIHADNFLVSRRSSCLEGHIQEGHHILEGVAMATPWLTCARAQGMRTGGKAVWAANIVWKGYPQPQLRLFYFNLNRN